MNLYFKIWADAIQFEKLKHGHFRNWKFYVLAGITFCQALNLATILFWVGTWVKIDFFLDVDIFPGKLLNNAFSGFITLILPLLLINYLLIFQKNKYESLLKEYQFRNGKLYLLYYIFSFSLFLLPIIIGFVLSKLF